ncbi:titin homolog [Pseudomyrmex gracilis]|uniref:titin homolog n=1 Tax=Pseudomyrmex gracilis TaxID=219809 RepID=UPI000994B81B|nr:titin homolog [Pseudomyrmex gracilis]XP_020283935.1 titin homolog [Pseudomyrmex gracilis]
MAARRNAEKRTLRPRTKVAKASGSTQRQLRPRKVVDKNQNTIEEAFKRSSKNANQRQRRSKEQKSTQKTDETNKKLPIYKNISPEKSLEDQDSVYEFTFDPNDTQERIPKKKRLNAKKRKKGDTKTQKNVKKNKKKRIDTHIAEDKISPLTTLAKQTEELSIKNVETENIKKEKKKQIDIHTAEDKIPTATELANQTQEVNIEKVETENSEKKKKEQVDIHTAEDRISSVTELAEPTKDLTVENVETESTEKEGKKQIDIHVAEDKTLSVTERAKQLQELNTKDVETENTKKDIKRIDAAEEKTSFVATPAKQNENLSTPKIISIENVDNMIVNRISSTDFRSPLRPRNLVNNTIVKRGDDSNYLSLTKSLSPISNTANVASIDSPWRPPTLSMFSRAKYFVQSTPIVHSNINKKSSKEGKENKQTTKKREFVKKNKGAIKPIKTLTEQENRENKFLETDNEDLQITNGETVEKRKDERLAENKEDSKISAKEENKHLIDYLNFSDTFDVLSESEKRSTFGTEIRLFEDAEPTRFSEPPKRFYKRKRGVKVSFLEESDREEENARENKRETKKKRKYTKADKENEKRISDWIQNVNSSFEEIDNYDLLVE